MYGAIAAGSGVVLSVVRMGWQSIAMESDAVSIEFLCTVSTVTVVSRKVGSLLSKTWSCCALV